MLLPFIEQKAVYDRIDFNLSWNHTDNRPIVYKTVIDLYICPSDPVADGKPQSDSAATSYCLSAGPTSDWNLPRPVGLVTLRNCARMSAVTDGSSNTIALGEVAIGSNQGKRNFTARNSAAGLLNNGNGATNWTQYVFDANNQAHVDILKDYMANCVANLKTAAVDGNDDDVGRFWAAGQLAWGPWMNTLAPPNAGAVCDDDASVTIVRVKSPSSHHPGGAQVSMLDAKVTFVSETVDHAVFLGAGSIAGEESTQLQ